MATPTTTSDEVRKLLNRALVTIAPHARGQGVIGDWREVWGEVTLAIEDLRAAADLIHQQVPRGLAPGVPSGK
jgi:hypothetical protein